METSQSTIYKALVAFIKVSLSGSNPRPGEITLAHHGILFLDELPEFDRKVLEVLREPLESGSITVSRAARQSDFPVACLKASDRGVFNNFNYLA